MISFKANLVQRDNVQQYVTKPIVEKSGSKKGNPLKTVGYKLKINKYPVSFLELNPFDEADQSSMERIVKIWGTKGIYTPFMSNMFQYTGDKTTDVNSRFFVLTRQSEDFDYLNPEHFLGLAQVTKLDNGRMSLDALQVNPFYLFNNPYGDIKQVGKTLMKQLLSLFSKTDFELFSPNNNVPFFELLGFNVAKSQANKNEVFMQLKNKISTGVRK